jgi:RNA polymerase sigma-70 factor (ECF subfamily)
MTEESLQYEDALLLRLEGGDGRAPKLGGQDVAGRGYSKIGVAMTDESLQDEDALLLRLEGGDERALIDLFTKHRERLRRMVRLRLDRRLQGRIDSSDILQDAYVEVARRAKEYLAQPTMPPFLWLRFLTGQTLQALHRHHLKVHMRDAAQEVSLRHRPTPQANSASLAEMLLGRLTSPSRAARRAEMQLRLQEIINGMEPIDREILALRHFEELSNGEVAQVLGLSKTAASNRYIRALERLKELVQANPGYLDY